MPSSNSSSSSTTSQTTNAINPVVVADNGSLTVSGIAGGNLNQVINNTTLDGEVAGKAMDNMLTMGQDALLFGNDAMRQSYSFSRSVNDTAFSFADASNKAANATSTAALSSAGSSMDKALQFGAQQTGVALDALAGSATMIDKAYKDAKGVLSTNVILVGIGATVLVLFFALRKH